MNHFLKKVKMLVMSLQEELLFRGVKIKRDVKLKREKKIYEDSQEICPKCIYLLGDAITFSKEKQIEQTSGLLQEKLELSPNMYLLPSVLNTALYK